MFILAVTDINGDTTIIDWGESMNIDGTDLTVRFEGMQVLINNDDISFDVARLSGGLAISTTAPEITTSGTGTGDLPTGIAGIPDGLRINDLNYGYPGENGTYTPADNQYIDTHRQNDSSYVSRALYSNARVNANETILRGDLSALSSTGSGSSNVYSGGNSHEFTDLPTAGTDAFSVIVPLRNLNESNEYTSNVVTSNSSIVTLRTAEGDVVNIINVENSITVVVRNSSGEIEESSPLPFPDGRYVTVGISVNESGTVTVSTIDTETGQILGTEELEGDFFRNPVGTHITDVTLGGGERPTQIYELEVIDHDLTPEEISSETQQPPDSGPQPGTDNSDTDVLISIPLNEGGTEQPEVRVVSYNYFFKLSLIL